MFKSELNPDKWKFSLCDMYIDVRVYVYLQVLGEPEVSKYWW